MITAKPHKEYVELVELIRSRGMNINNENYAVKKLSQVGYYRLSGFWFTSRYTETKEEHSKQISYFIDKFLPNTCFNEIYKLYLFDKKLRLLLLDIIERLEVNIRSVLAHELGRIKALSYLDESLINPKYLKNYKEIWLVKLKSEISKSKDDFISWHTKQDKEIPFWVIIEIWEFGTLSKYYSFLKGGYQTKIAKKFGTNGNTFGKWLHEINLLRNLCAHHSRVWNKEFNAIRLPSLNTEPKTSLRIWGRILVLWYLVKHTGSTNYKWLDKLYSLIKEDFPNVPNAKLESMGINGDIGQIIHLLKKDKCD